MLRFWTNPEFLRHRRAELRLARTITVLAVTAVICILILFSCWGSREREVMSMRYRLEKTGTVTPQQLADFERQSPRVIAQDFHYSLGIALLGILTFWSLLSTAQSISGERERKTWDFQLTTRLSSGELLVGKLLGEPIMAYLIAACCLPLLILSGVIGGFPLKHVLAACVLIVSAGLFIGLAGLWLSSLFESKSRGVGLIGTFGIYVVLALTVNFAGSDFPGLASFSCLASLRPLLGGDTVYMPYRAALFGKVIPWTAMTLLMYAVFGLLLVLMLLRNLKRDYDEARQLSRWQAIGCVGLLNLLFYALYHPQRWSDLKDYTFASFMVIINIPILAAMGLTTLTSYERLKVWHREHAAKRASVLAEDGPSWPWLILAALLGYAMLCVFARRFGVPVDALKAAAVQMIAILIFIARDMTFLQWCRLTRMRAPVLKGILFLALYYIGSVVVAIVISALSESTSVRVFHMLAPFDILGPQRNGFHFAKSVFVGMGIHLALAIGMMWAVFRKLSRPLVLAPAAGD